MKVYKTEKQAKIAAAVGSIRTLAYGERFGLTQLLERAATQIHGGQVYLVLVRG